MAEHFESVGAPLTNVRWSWGARRPTDGALFLRAWKDELRRDANGQQWVKIWDQSGNGHGWQERQAHIEEIEAGARCFMVMCEALDTLADPRTVAGFDRRRVLVGGEIQHEQGVAWIRVADDKSIWEVR